MPHISISRFKFGFISSFAFRSFTQVVTLLCMSTAIGCGGGGGGGGGAVVQPDDISVDVVVATAPLLASFTEISGLDPAAVDSWLWDFGDPASGAANTSAAQNPSHQYNSIGSYSVTLTITAGGETRTTEKLGLITVEQPGLKINEILARNRNGLRDEDGDTSDWIEIYNAGPGTQSLGGWALTDDEGLPTKWLFPSLTLGPQEYLLVFASNKNRTDTGGPNLHTNFKMDGDGEYLALTDSTMRRTRFHMTTFPNQEENISYGVPAGGSGPMFLEEPTPKALNGNEGFLGFTPSVSFIPESGIYDEFLEVEMESPMKGVEIYFSRDGSDPVSGNGSQYNGAVFLNQRSILTAQAIAPGYLPSRVKSATYLINSSPALLSLPVISIVGDAGRALYEPDGIMAIVGGEYVSVPERTQKIWMATNPGDYNNVTRRGRDAERFISFGYFDEDRGIAFENGAGIRVHGSDYTRLFMQRDEDWNTLLNKFAFRLYFREVYGEKKLNMELFPSPAPEKFDQLVLRSGRTDFLDPFIRDEFGRRLFMDMGQVASAGINVNLLVNNVYRGYYNLVERYTEDFLNQRFEMDEDWDLIDLDGANEGTIDAWALLDTYIRNSDDPPETFFSVVDGVVEIENFIDYLILETYAGNVDWTPNNWLAARPRIPGGKFIFLPWDLEQSFQSRYKTLNLFVEGVFGHLGLDDQDDAIALLYKGLKESESFKILMAERALMHFGPGGGLHIDNLRSRFDELREDMSGVLPNMSEDIFTIWIPNREGNYLHHLAEEGFPVD